MARDLAGSVVVITGASSGIGLAAAHSVAPRTYDRVLPPAFEAGNQRRAAQPHDAGQVLDALPRHNEVSGGWRRLHRPELARAFLAAAAGGLRGLIGR